MQQQVEHHENINYFKLIVNNYLILLIAISLLAIPTIYSMSQTIWQNDDQAHGPIILGMVLWVFWELKAKLVRIPNKSSTIGWPLIGFALLFYVFGSSQEIWLFEVGSFIPLVAGLILIHKSIDGLKCCWFPLLFMLFVIPLPNFIVDAITSSLKQNISDFSESILYFWGYPIARTGVTITIGQYQLLVADACSGLHSMFSLFALGLFYLYIQEYSSKLHNLLMFIFIAPIAFISNMIRVIALVLVTYYYGDDAGQGFIHSAAGFLLFIIALFLLYLLDLILMLFVKRNISRGKHESI